jgi:hypothetical protein
LAITYHMIAESISHWLLGRHVTVRSRHFQILGRETELFFQ